MAPASVTLSLLLALCSFATSAQSVRSMKLVAAQTGWAATQTQLFWTTDSGAKWKNITPPNSSQKAISSVFFMDSVTGWVLLASGNASSQEPFFDLAFTSDAGTNWSVTKITLPRKDSGANVFTGAGNIFFLDVSRGWMNLDVASSSNFRLGTLLMTEDSGKTWEYARSGPNQAGSIFFVTVKNGWMAGGPGDEFLYATHDGGNSWKQVTLKPPAQSPAAGYALYAPPVFTDSTHGFLPVTYHGEDGLEVWLVLFETDDGGTNWKPERVLRHLPDTGAEPVPAAIVNDELKTAMTSGSEVTVTSVVHGGGSSSLKAKVSPHTQPIRNLSFTSSSEGWMLTPERLFSTTDGGATWREITPVTEPDLGVGFLPPDGTDFVPQFSVSPEAVNPELALASSIHVGFDQCAASTVPNMGKWWTYSPYFDTGIYIGGASRSCSQPNLKSSWVSSVQSQGWGLMPLWAGPQAPCACKGTSPPCTPFPHTFSSTPSVAKTQGVTEANSAKTAAAGLGLAGTIIYYDMENYTSSQCGAAVTAFLNGWISQSHTNGYNAGVYGSPADAQNDWSITSPPADYVWIAKTPLTGQPPLVTIWGLSPLCDPYSAAPCNLWSDDERIHQYLMQQTETWGGIQFSIDEDIEAAGVAGTAGNKSYAYTFTALTCTGLPNLFAEGINNLGQIVGTSATTSETSVGFLYNNGTCTSIAFSGADSTNLTGINDASQIVGDWSTGDQDPGGVFIYQNGQFTVFPNDPNAAFCGAGFFCTTPEGIDDDGQVVGFYYDGKTNHGFLYNNGNFTTIDDLGAFSDYLISINGDTHVAGSWLGDGSAYNGFYYEPENNTFVEIAYPGASQTLVNAINDNNQLVGEYYDSNDKIHGFLYSKGTYTTIDFNGAAETELNGINDKGQIVGRYSMTTLPFTNTFIATPTQP